MTSGSSSLPRKRKRKSRFSKLLKLNAETVRIHSHDSRDKLGDKISGIKLKKITHVDGPKELSIMEQKLMTKGWKTRLVVTLSRLQIRIIVLQAWSNE